MREIKLRMQVLQAARRLSRAAHGEPCHWSEGCNNMGVTAGKAGHNASNVRGVTAGKVRRNSSSYFNSQPLRKGPKTTDNSTIAFVRCNICPGAY